MPPEEPNTTETTPTPTPAPKIAGDNALVKKVTELEARVEALEKYAADQGAKLETLTKPATAPAKRAGRFFKD